MVTIPVILAMLAAAPSDASPRWSQLAPLPETQGVAGAFAGVSGGAMLVAGGANFPEKPPWEGGKKVWYDRVLVLDRPDGDWRVAGTLPRPLGYGVSVSHRDGVICVGGSGPDRHFADVFRLSWDGQRLTTTSLPALPRPLANASGALVGDRLYVAGGQETPDAARTLKSVYVLDLAEASPRWRELPPWPGGGRMLAIAASREGVFWLIGGVDLVEGKGGQATRRYLRDAYRHDPGKGWTRVADLPHPLAASPSPAAGEASGIWVFGGDDGSKLGFTPPEAHPGFNPSILRYRIQADAWEHVGNLPAARVTAPLVRWRDRWVILSGEARPGVRSPQVWSCLELDSE